jgi:prephenate dehydrogenase
VIRRLCIIGVGLMGGSLARALRGAGRCEEVVGAGRSAATLEKAQALGVIDRYEHEMGRAAEGADLIVVAVPLGATADVFRAIKDQLTDDVVLTDVGSAKRVVLDAAAEAFGRVPPNLVPGHPIAGTEKSGVEASSATLFAGHRVILTPVPETDPVATARVKSMWETVGAEVIEMDPDHHDEVLAATSHLPHVLAYVLVDVLGHMEQRREIFRYAAGGFRDFTRIASSDPQMWHDICVANRDAILEALEHFDIEFRKAIDLIRRGDSAGIKALFTRAKQLRDRYAEQR